MTDTEIDLAIDKTHLKSPEKMHPHIVKKHPGVSLKRLKAVNKKRPKDKNPHDPKSYYYPIFSNHPYSFQLDLLEQSHNRDQNEYPAYYVIIINVNTKYAYAIPIEDKKQDTIHDVLKDFIENHRVITFVCDEEGALQSKKVIDMLSKKKVAIKFINDQRHSALAVVDRFIRTLRDMNTPTVHTQRQSNDPKYRDFSKHRMEKLLNIYNTTKHSSTGHTPKEMEEDINLEKKYIIKKLYEVNRRKKITDYDLEPDTFVRYILPKDPKKKRRFKISPEAYKISHKEGNAYVLMAADGTTKTVSRWRLFPLGKNLPEKMKFANTFGNNNGTVNKIISHNKRNGTYEVEFVMPDGTTYNDTIPERNLRGTTPQIMSYLEKQFFNE